MGYNQYESMSVEALWARLVRYPGDLVARHVLIQRLNCEHCHELLLIEQGLKSGVLTYADALVTIMDFEVDMHRAVTFPDLEFLSPGLPAARYIFLGDIEE